MKILLLTLPVAAAAGSVCPTQQLRDLGVDGVQELLKQWNLDAALGQEFLEQKVDGYKLNIIEQPSSVWTENYPNAQPFDWTSLRAHIKECQTKPTSISGHRRRLGDVSGLEINKDNGGIVLGENGDVSLYRSGDQELSVGANAVVGGDLSVVGHVHLLSGNVTAANIEELQLSVNAVLGTVQDLSDAIDSLQATVDGLDEAVDGLDEGLGDSASALDDLSAASKDFQWDIAVLNNATNDLMEQVSENSDNVDELLDSVEVLTALVDPYGSRVVYESDFGNSVSEWTFDGADVQSYDCAGLVGVGGNLGEDDSISTYISLPAHSEITVEFTFVAIDSWDGETGHCSIDGEDIWSEAITHSDGDENICGNTGATWKENIIVVEAITVDHFMEGTTLGFTSTVDQGYTDETWAIADITVSTSLSPDYSLFFESDFASNLAAGWTFLGGVDAETSVCGDSVILGGYDVLAKSGSVVKQLSNLGEHTLLTISFEWVKIDTWDGEYAKLYVDDNLVWSQSMDKYTSDATICGGTSVDAIVPVTLHVPHDEDMAKLRFTSTLNQGATDESWGLRSVTVYGSSPDEHVVYETNFETVGAWVFDEADAEITECGEYNVLGGYDVLGEDASLTLFLSDLVPHTSMTIDFFFVKVDSWDGEAARFYIDDTLEWTKAMYASSGSQICGASNSNWHEDFVPVSFTFDHFAHGVKLFIDTTLNQGASDESWGIAEMKITTTIADGYTLVYSSDFTSNLMDGWVIDNAYGDNVTTCGDDVILGGYGNFGIGATASTVIEFDDGEVGRGVVVGFTFMKIDSWDSENGRLYANDVLVWDETLYGSSGGQECGRTNTNWHEEKVIREIDLGWVTDDSVTLTWTSTLSSAPTDESWGLLDVDVYTYIAQDAVAYQSAFDTDGDTGWIFSGSDGGTTSCNGMAILGGYKLLDYTDMASHMATLPVHTRLQVDFTFVKIDSWDNEDAYFYLDYTQRWTEEFAYNDGAQLCGSGNTNWNEDLVEVTVEIDHFSPLAWLSWQSGLSSAGSDESWGIANVRVSTFMDATFIPVYQSRFQFGQLDGWDVTNLDSNADGYFTSCQSVTMLGGYATFAKDATASRTVTHLPTHTSATIAWTWSKIDSWDGEYFYVYADGSAVFSQKGSASDGYHVCGRSNTNWDEAFYSQYVTIDHTADSIDLEFTTSINQGATDESWGLVGVSVYVSN